jgi:hypothetical protein
VNTCQFARHQGNRCAEKRETFRQAWERIPEIGEEEAFGYVMRELESAGRSYLHALKQGSDLRYQADLTTHDVTIALPSG